MRLIFVFVFFLCFLQTDAQSINKKTLAKGKEVYSLYCLPCHQEDGAGVPHLNPPLGKTSYVLGDKKKLIGIVLNGFQDKVEINGDTYSNVMAPHDFLTDEEISSVLTLSLIHISEPTRH